MLIVNELSQNIATDGRRTISPSEIWTDKQRMNHAKPILPYVINLGAEDDDD